jgi:hypothetical protein
MTSQNQYRIEVYDLNKRDTWNEGMYSGVRNYNWNQNLMNWARGTFQVAISGAQSAFWVYRVGVTQVRNGETINLYNDGTNKLVIVSHAERADFTLTMRLTLSKWLQESDTYKKFEEAKSKLNSEIESKNRDVHVQLIVQKYKTRLQKWNVDSAEINDMLSSVYVDHSLYYQFHLVLNDDRMHAFLTTQFVGTDNWDIRQRLVDCEIQFMQRIRRTTIEYKGNTPNVPLDCSKINSIMHEVEMPYAVTQLTELPGRQGDGEDLDGRIQAKKHEITRVILANTEEITDTTTKFIEEIKKTLDDQGNDNAEIQREWNRVYLEALRIYLEFGTEPREAHKLAESTANRTLPPRLLGSFSHALPDDASKNNANDAG